jgi:cysteinyl-tRNA synthetase
MLAREGLLPVKDESGAVEKFSSEFRAALEDDLNTPRALAALSHIEGKVFSEDAKAALRLFDDIFGFQLVFDLPLHDNILEAIDQYETARENKDFKKSDNLRQDLLNQYGLVLSDTPVGALVHREKQ